MSTIALVHALASSGRAWAPQIAGLGDRHRVLAPDLPGHGDAPGPFTLRRAVDSVVAAIDQAGGTAHLVGISGGAVVALLAALDHPDRVDSLLLSAGLARPPRWFALQRAAMRIAPEPLLVRALGGLLSGGRPEHAQAAAADVRRCGKRTFLAGLAELATVDVRPRLGRVTMPALVVCGSKDRFNIPLSRELAAWIPVAELRIVPGAEHIWNLQQPEAFNRTLAAFVEWAAPGDA
jgi:pimeloyl-ACP methyl ester carboxylesterase